MIVLTQQQASHLLWQHQFRESELRPRRCSDGRYALPESVLSDRRHARWHSLLRQGEVVSASSLTFASPVNGADFAVTVDGKEMSVLIGATPTSFGFPVPRLFDMPADNLYRFECHRNNDQTGGDGGNGRRRVELVIDHNVGYSSGETLWASWATVLTDQRDGFMATNGTLIHQWHSSLSSSYIAPPFWVALSEGKLHIASRSSATPDVNTYHYQEDFNPATGTPTYFVIQGTLGSSGHLNVWMNGSQIVNVDTPIGYYSEPYPLAYPQQGAYMNNVRTVDVLYHANIEFGLTDLSARIATPLAVPTPPDGWV